MNRGRWAGFFALTAASILPQIWPHFFAWYEKKSTLPLYQGAENEFHFAEIAESIGLKFQHAAPQFDSSLDAILPIIASMGAAISIADFDGDGFDDLYAVTSKENEKNGLYRNLGNGTFSKTDDTLGLADVNRLGTGVSMGSVWGDYDNDGFEDVLLYKYGKPELFRNIHGKRFARVTDSAGLPNWVNANTALWLDFDCDGLLDIFLAGYFPDTLDLWHLQHTRIMPESFEYARNGGRKFLLKNLGHGKFKDVAKSLGLQSTRWTLAAVAGDFQKDGWPDLFLANDYGVSELFLNERGHFREMGREAGVALAPKSGMNAALGDITNRGEQSIYVSNITEPGILVQGNNLWVPTSMAKVAGKVLPRFENMARLAGVEHGGWSFGAQFGDLNNDGWLDLFLVNGFIAGSKPESYWYDYSQITGAHSGIIADASHWPPMKNRGLADAEPKKVWLNQGDLHFREVALDAGIIDRREGRAVALADFRKCGKLDMVVAHQKGPLCFYQNQSKAKEHWLAFHLQGIRSNRSAIGASVQVEWNGMTQLQTVLGGSGFASQNSRRLHFGLGNALQADRAVIRWPSGLIDTLLAPKADSQYHVLEQLP